MSEQKSIKFEIVTPERVVFRQEVAGITVPTVNGEITILPNHIPLVSVLQPGVLLVHELDGGQRVLSVSGGFVEVLSGKIVILADTAELASELDVERIKEARLRAEKLKQDFNQDEVAFAEVSALLEKELARKKAVIKYRKLKQ